MYSLFPGCGRYFVGVRCVWTMWLGLALGMAPMAEAAKPVWKPVAPEELAETKPKLEAEAAAEVLFWNIEVDDREYPYERTMKEYIRYKVFDPQKVENITRVSDLSITGLENRNDLRARLILPGGKVQEFDKGAFKERSLAKQGKERGFLGWLAGNGAEVKEKFLAITGVEAGAVLEYQVTRVEKFPQGVQVFVAQREGIPVRQMDFVCRTIRDDGQFAHTLFVFNKQSAQMSQDTKAKVRQVTATNLPSTTVEPMMGPATDYALTILSCYASRDVGLSGRSGKVPVPGTVEAKFGPWAFYSTLVNWFERDRSWATKRVKQLAGEITAGAADEADKARRVHDHVRAMVQKWRKRTPANITSPRFPNSLDDVIDWEKSADLVLTAEEFMWLAIALDQSAGLEAHTVLLPNRQLSRFYRENVSPVFLPNMAVAVRIAGEWRFSSPHHGYALPFGMLPWEQEGQGGLLALDRKEEFVPVAPAPPSQTVMSNFGVFEIDPEGGLSGSCRKGFTGHSAALLRTLLAPATEERRAEIAKEKFGFDTKLVEVTVTKITGVDEVEKPLELTATVRWPGYAVRTKDRLVLRAAVFRAEASSLYTATERRHPVHFPYRWQEMDRLAVRLPAGYEPEDPTAPAPLLGEVLSSRTQLRYEKDKNTLHLLREFSSSLMDVGPQDYAKFRKWHAALARNDQHELVFIKRTAAEAKPAEGEGEKKPATTEK